MTHSDSRAESGSLVIAIAAREALLHGSEIDSAQLMDLLCSQSSENQLGDRLNSVRDMLTEGAEPDQLIERLDLHRGITGYINDTVPAALFCWLRYKDDYRKAVESVIVLGGDTDSTGAIVGALAGANLGRSAIPDEWIERIGEWPRSVNWLDQLANRLAMLSHTDPNDWRKIPLFWPGLIPRNAAFLCIVLMHGFRRLLPPY